MNSDLPLVVDSHCHIHDEEFEFKAGEVLLNAKKANIGAMICVGTDVASSHSAHDFCAEQPNCYYSVALHPHQARDASVDQLEEQFKSLRKLVAKNSDKLVAIGECGLDYYYHSDQKIKDRQKHLLKLHLQLAKEYDLPVIFHVRSAFDDFWPIYDQFNPKGVLHSFSDTPQRVQEALTREQLYFGLNGIMTFTKDPKQLEAAKLIPLDRLMLETDAPFLTPAPLRGKINEPKNVQLVASFLSDLRGETLSLLTDQTNINVQSLFGITLLN